MCVSVCVREDCMCVSVCEREDMHACECVCVVFQGSSEVSKSLLEERETGM